MSRPLGIATCPHPPRNLQPKETRSCQDPPPEAAVISIRSPFGVWPSNIEPPKSIQSYQRTLPNDSAVALRVPVDGRRQGIRPCTTATAMDAGWMVDRFPLALAE